MDSSNICSNKVRNTIWIISNPNGANNIRHSPNSFANFSPMVFSIASIGRLWIWTQKGTEWKTPQSEETLLVKSLRTRIPRSKENMKISVATFVILQIEGILDIKIRLLKGFLVRILPTNPNFRPSKPYCISESSNSTTPLSLSVMEKGLPFTHFLLHFQKWRWNPRPLRGSVFSSSK